MLDNSPEFSEDVLEFLVLLIEEDLQQRKLNKSAPENRQIFNVDSNEIRRKL